MSGVVPVDRRKALCTLVVTALVAAACGREHPTADTSFTVRMLTVRTISGRWELAAERGLGRIAAVLGADVARIRLDDPAEDRGRLVEQGRAGVDLVFCVGGFNDSVLYSVAAAFPKTVFVMLPGRVRAENLAGISFLPEEAGYLAGAVAGALAPDGRLGLLHGSGRAWLEPLEEGYVAGFASRQKRVKVIEGEGVDGVWELSAAGVLVSLYATDRADPAVLAAAHDAGIRLVVTDPDLLISGPGTVIAAVDVDVAEAMLRVAREVRDGTFVGRVFDFDLGSGVLDVVVDPELAPDMLTQADQALGEARAEITAGLVEFDELGL